MHPNYGKGIQVELSIQVGDTYAIPLDKGEYGICRVINSSSTRSEKYQGFMGFNAPLVSACHFKFETLPTIAELSPGKNLYIDNLAKQMKSTDPKEYLIKFYVHTSPPEDFVYLGNIEPTAIESELSVTGIGDWDNLKNQW